MKSEQFAISKGFIRKVTVHDEVEATVALADVKAIDIGGAKAISIQITEAETNNRSGALTVYLSNDGVNFIAYNMIIDNVTNTNGQNITRVASKTRNANGSDIIFLDPQTIGGATYMKLPLTITDAAAPAGKFTVIANVQF